MSMAWPCASVVPQFNDFDVGLVENRPKLYCILILSFPFYVCANRSGRVDGIRI